MHHISALDVNKYYRTKKSERFRNFYVKDGLKGMIIPRTFMFIKRHNVDIKQTLYGNPRQQHFMMNFSRASSNENLNQTK